MKQRASDSSTAVLSTTIKEPLGSPSHDQECVSPADEVSTPKYIFLLRTMLSLYNHNVTSCGRGYTHICTWVQPLTKTTCNAACMVVTKDGAFKSLPSDGEEVNLAKGMVTYMYVMRQLMLVCENVLPRVKYQWYGRYWYAGMAHVPHMCNTNMHGQI